MIKIKLELDSLTDIEVVDKLKLVAEKVEGNPTFPTLPIGFDTLTDDAAAIVELLDQRTALEQSVQGLTLQIRNARMKGENDLNAEAGYVEGVINKLVPPATMIDPVVAAAQALSAGMEIQGSASTVGAMPKILGLFATQGDVDGEIDLHWNPIKRGLMSYVIEKTDDPTGQTGWTHAKVESKSKTSVLGLVTGKRYWFRVAAVGSAGQGPWSDPATKVAP